MLNKSNRINNFFFFFLKDMELRRKKRERKGVVWLREKVPLQLACGAQCTCDMRARFLFSFNLFSKILDEGKSWSSAFVILTKILENPTLPYFLNFETFSLHSSREATCSLSDKASK